VKLLLFLWVRPLAAAAAGALCYRQAYALCDQRAALRPLLRDTAGLLSAAGIPFWLDYGTLLGAVREHDIIPWEYDVDLGVEESQVRNRLPVS
jgi:hypothetical protein